MVEFTHVTRLHPEALGEPGKRVFRILVEADDGSAVIWVEKQLLLQLAMGINEVLATLSKNVKTVDEESGQMASKPQRHVEFKAGKMVLGHPSIGERLVVVAHEVDSGDNSGSSVRIWGDIECFKAFAEKSIQVCAAGRPICQLCKSPVDNSGHWCPGMNGHSPTDFSEV